MMLFVDFSFIRPMWTWGRIIALGLDVTHSPGDLLLKLDLFHDIADVTLTACGDSCDQFSI